MAEKKAQGSEKTILDKLNKKFSPKEIDWVIINAFDYSTTNGTQIKAFAQPYIKKEVAEQTADEVFGPEGWENDYDILNKGGWLKYWIRYRFDMMGEWTYKRSSGSVDMDGDGGFQGNDFETAISYAEKRCWSKVGIGRYLKLIPAIEVDISRKWRKGWNKYSFKSKVDKGNYTSFYWKPPHLPAEALPEGYTYPLANQPEDNTPPPPPAPKKKKEATEQDWKTLMAYYNHISQDQQDMWQPYLFTEIMDEQTGEVQKIEHKRISHQAAQTYIEKMIEQYGKLNKNGEPSNVAIVKNEQPLQTGVPVKKVKDMFDGEIETEKK